MRKTRGLKGGWRGLSAWRMEIGKGQGEAGRVKGFAHRDKKAEWKEIVEKGKAEREG